MPSPPKPASKRAHSEEDQTEAAQEDAPPGKDPLTDETEDRPKAERTPTPPPAKKRKANAPAPAKSKSEPNKGSRSSRRQNTRSSTSTSAAKSLTDTNGSEGENDRKTKIVNFLLGDEVLGMINRVQKDEKSGVDGEGKDEDDNTSFSFPRDQLNPFQSLLAALLLSKPFSHVIATRAIETVFARKGDEELLSLRTPGEVREVGYDGIYALLERARTLHRGKTSQQFIDLAEMCCAESDPSEVELVWLIEPFLGGSTKADGEKDEKSQLDLDGLKKSIVKKFNGYGPKTVEIFLRRAQAATGSDGEPSRWSAVYPFVDEAGLSVARDAGLVGSTEGAEELAEVVGSATETGEAEKVDESKRRRDFGRVVDVLVYLGLEGKVQDAVERATAGDK